jgi:hypothetical protein
VKPSASAGTVHRSVCRCLGTFFRHDDPTWVWHESWPRTKWPVKFDTLRARLTTLLYKLNLSTLTIISPPSRAATLRWRREASAPRWSAASTIDFPTSTGATPVPTTDRSMVGCNAAYLHHHKSRTGCRDTSSVRGSVVTTNWSKVGWPPPPLRATASSHADRRRWMSMYMIFVMDWWIKMIFVVIFLWFLICMWWVQFFLYLFVLLSQARAH